MVRMPPPFLVLAVILSPAPASPATDSISGYEELYDALADPPPGGATAARIDTLTLHRDAATFALAGGDIYLARPVGGRSCLAIYRGAGTFALTPPTAIERAQLRRFHDADSLRERFDALVLVFADGTGAELAAALAFARAEIPEAALEHARESAKYMGDSDSKELDRAIPAALLNGERNDLFYAYVHRESAAPLFFSIDPYAAEGVSLLFREPSGRGHVREEINRFARSGGVGPADEARRTFRIQRYEIDARLERSLDFAVTADLELTAARDSLAWIDFTLSHRLEVDEVAWRDGPPVAFFRGKDSASLWARCEPPLATGETRVLRLRYHGDILERDGDWIYLKSSISWYPHSPEPAGGATFDLTYHTPSDYVFTSVGHLIGSQIQDHVTLSHWVVPDPIRNASFAIGLYKEFKVEDSRIPPVRVLMARGGHQEIAAELLETAGVSSGKDMEKQVGADIANSIAFFQKVYGKAPVPEFCAAEIPYEHGEAFPGLVHLSWATFQQTGSAGYDEIFRAHEVAHQWWGIGVDFETYHDQWLSEGFAEYSGLWYMQAVRQDNGRFFDVLRDWRNEIIHERRLAYGSTKESGPIWLGYRTASSGTPAEYDLIVYKKGAWVLHMLRNMLLDLKTMNDDRFIAMMRDFYGAHAGGEASTEDFKQICDKHLKMDMGWFFDQWVYGTAIPRVEFAYKVERPEGEQYKVRCRVRQSEVPDDFQMFVPLRLEFGKDKAARLKVFVEGPVSEFDLPLLPLKPERIVFNDLESVLCEVETVKWK